MPYYLFRKPKGTTAWTLKGSFTNYGAARTARDSYASASADVVVRLVSAHTESEARGKGGSTWNAITNDIDA